MADRVPAQNIDPILVEYQIRNSGKSVGVAYLLWFFLWFVSAHRFYLGKPKTAFLQIASYFVLVGFAWLIIDAILIPGMVRASHDAFRERMARSL